MKAALEAVAGVNTASVNAASGIALAEYDPQVVTLPMLTAAVKSAGGRVGGAQTRIGIQNLRCASCVQFIEDELRSTPGVFSASVNVGTQEATVDYLPEKTACAASSPALAPNEVYGENSTSLF